MSRSQRRLASVQPMTPPAPPAPPAPPLVLGRHGSMARLVDLQLSSCAQSQSSSAGPRRVWFSWIRAEMQWLGQRQRAEEPAEPAEAGEAGKAAEAPGTSPPPRAPRTGAHASAYWA